MASKEDLMGKIIDWRDELNAIFRENLYNHIVGRHIPIRYYRPKSATVTHEKPKSMKKTKELIIHPSKTEFYFGNCASIAICSAFGIPYIALRTITFMLKLNINEGLSFFECKEIINLIAKANGKNAEYVPNYTNVTFKQMLLLLNNGKYITMFGNHISYSENGEVYDTYIDNMGQKEREELVPTGWWKIN